MVEKSKDAIERLDSLTSLRFLAALAVFIYHAKLLEPLLARFVLGEVGVGFFFMLSGFIMTYVYIKKLHTFSIAGTLKFYLSRFAKLYPMHIITMFLATPGMFRSYGMVIGGAIVPFVVFAAVCNILLIQAYFPGSEIIYSFNNVSWSISVEAFFYTLFPFIIAIVGKFNDRLSPKHLLIGSIVLWIIMITVNTFFHPTMLLPLYRLPEFLIGICGGLYFLKSRQLFAHSTNRRSTSRELLAALFFLISLLAFPLMAGSDYAVSTLMAPSIFAVILIFAYGRGLLSKILSMKYFVFLGDISFSFYMLHNIVIGNLGAVGHMGLTALALVITIALSTMSYFAIEESARIKIKTFGEKLIDRRFPTKKRVIVTN